MASLLLAAFVAPASPAEPADAPLAFLADLGTLPGGTISGATGINAFGGAVGYSNLAGADTSHGVLFHWPGPPVDLNSLLTRPPAGFVFRIATDINNLGWIVGQGVLSGNFGAAALQPRLLGYRPVLLGPFDGRWSSAVGINNVGQAVGLVELPAGNTHAFVWELTTGRGKDLGTLGGANSYGQAINDFGTVVGFAQTAGGQTHGFSWTRRGGIVDAGTLPGGTTSGFYALNDAGEAVGYADDAAGIPRAVRYDLHGRQFTVLPDIEPPIGDPEGAYAYGINFWGTIVGADTGGGTAAAFRWRNGTLLDLNTLRTIGDSFASLQAAAAVSFYGVIAGRGTPTDAPGETHAFLLTLACPDVTSQVNVELQSRSSTQSVQKVRLTNTGSTPIDGPLYLVLDDLSPGVTLANRSGETRFTQPAESPHLAVGAGDDRQLQPGEQVIVTLRFHRRGSAAIHFRPRVLAGEGQP